MASPVSAMNLVWREAREVHRLDTAGELPETAERAAVKSEESCDGHLRRDTGPHAKMMRLSSENIFGPQLNFVHG